MWAVFKINGKVHLDYCYKVKGGLYTFTTDVDEDGRSKMYLIYESNILGYGKKEDLLTEFAEHFI